MKRILNIIIVVAVLLVLPACSERNLGISSSLPEQQSSLDANSEADDTQSESSESSEPETSLFTLAERYADILRSGTYYIDGTAVIDVQGLTMENPMLIAVREGNSSISVSSDLSGSMVTIRTLVYEGQVYSINDAQRSYVQLDAQQAANSFDIDYSGMTYLDEKNGDFCGEQLPCAEYQQGEDTIRLFFRDRTLVGMTRTIRDEQVSEMVIKINGLSGNIPDRIVEIPVGYTKQ